MNETTKFTSLTFQPLTSERWDDFETVFGPRGATGGCWCMWNRLTNKEFEAQKGEGNRRSMKGIVESGHVPGILAYDGDEPVGWCSIAPRDDFPRLDRSRILKRIDDQPVWSITCFFIPRQHRRKGVMTLLLKGAVDYAVSQGATIIEGYPVEPKKDTYPDTFAWHGLAESFRAVGFKEVARRSETRPFMRYYIEE
ncbi:MAG: GNAT family N-acetyltransferase [Anaerolineales bacterium]|jgi:GNAT superfamily N-acetyltransferase